MARRSHPKHRRQPVRTARVEEQAEVTPRAGTVIFTATTADGSSGTIVDFELQNHFNSTAPGSVATINGDGSLQFLQPLTDGSDYTVTVTSSVDANGRIGYWWDAGPNVFTAAIFPLTANTPHTATAKIPGLGTKLYVFVGIDQAGTVTWANGTLTTIQQEITQSEFDPYRTSYDTVLSNNNLTATMGNQVGGFQNGPRPTGYTCVFSTPADPANVYFEFQPTMYDAIDLAWGVAGFSAPPGPGGAPQGEMGGPNSFGFFGKTGQVYMNGAQHPQGGSAGAITAPFFADGDWVGVAISFPTKTIATRNVTQNGPFTISYSFAAVAGAQLFGVGFFQPTNPANKQHVNVNFDGPFIGDVPDGFQVWKIYAPPPTPPSPPGFSPGFSEDPGIVQVFDAVIADGSYTSTGMNDREKMPFSIVKWGNASVDDDGNLVFNDPVTDDPPLLSITLTADGPSDNWIFGEWDKSGNLFLIAKTHIPGPGSSTVPIGNIPISSASPPTFGQGHTLTLYISCSSGTVFSWKDGHVFGTEQFLVWPPIEEAEGPPSVMGIRQPVIASSDPSTRAEFPQYTPLYPPPLVGEGGGAAPAFPPPTPPPIGHVPVGILIGPAVPAAAVPPSVAGIPLIRFTFGDATHPPASAAFPEFTTSYPVPPVLVTNNPPPTMVATTPPLGLSYNTGGVWGPPRGPALPPVVPTGPRPFMVATNGDPDDAIYEQPESEAEPSTSTNEVYDDSDEENEDWVDDTSRSSSSNKPKRGRGRKK